jgi:hypothetical protein
MPFFVGFVHVDIFSVILPDRCYVIHRPLFHSLEVKVIMPSVGGNMKYKGKAI